LRLANDVLLRCAITSTIHAIIVAQPHHGHDDKVPVHYLD